METKLVLFEGTAPDITDMLAKKSKALLAKRMETGVYTDIDVNPFDVKGCAFVPMVLGNNVMEQFPLSAEIIRKSMFILDKNVVIPIFAIEKKIDPSELEHFTRYLQGFGIYNGRMSDAFFSNTIRGLWKKFRVKSENLNRANIFVGNFFSNQITELMLFRNKDNMQVMDHIMTLMEEVISLSPRLIYCTKHSSDEDLHTHREAYYTINGDDRWYEEQIMMVEKSPFGQAKHLYGEDGLMRFWRERKKILTEVFEMLPLGYEKMDTTNVPPDKLWMDICVQLEMLYARELRG